MALGLIGKKVGMTRLFDQESGAMVPVTVIDVKGNTFAQIKTEDKDGYNAIQVAFDAQKESRVAKPQAGHFKKLGIQPTKLLRWCGWLFHPRPRLEEPEDARTDGQCQAHGTEPEGCGRTSGRQRHSYLRRRSRCTRFLPRDPPRQEEVRL